MRMISRLKAAVLAMSFSSPVNLDMSSPPLTCCHTGFSNYFIIASGSFFVKPRSNALRSLEHQMDNDRRRQLRQAYKERPQAPKMLKQQ